MTIFENTLVNEIHRRCRDEDWWIFSSLNELREHWKERSLNVDPQFRYFAVSVNERELNVVGFDALSEQPNIDMDSILISYINLEAAYEELYFGQCR